MYSKKEARVCNKKSVHIRVLTSECGHKTPLGVQG